MKDEGENLNLLFGAWVRLVVDREYVLGRQLRVALGGGETLVAQHLLNCTKVGPLFEHVRAKGMAQGVRMDIGRKAFGNRDLLHDSAYAAGGEATTAAVD